MIRYTRCYVCDRRSALQNAVRIGGEENVGEAIACVARRDGLGLPPQGVILDTRICFNCHQSIQIELNVIQGNPSAVRLNVLRQTRNASCVICNAVDYQMIDENCVNDRKFVCLTSVTKPQFEDMFAYCDRVAQQAGFRNVKRKDLIMLLCKLRQGLSDEFLTVLFSYRNRQATSLAVATVSSPITLEGADADRARASLERAEQNNVVQRLVEENNLATRTAQRLMSHRS
ncbi:hypothetical protein QAD02_020668 [Eretmocerus hayati]|uniref:Uncharacterized protein n=1 Tax=Eretmocerus hayati TaxID=131215 RepID=A0ACC2PN64_9HYME|nr:hypothetical protein QAD02_020668 [Eretmocerus hayati]